MAKAKRVHSTPRPTASLRKTSTTLRSAPAQALPAIDPEQLPDLYCLKLAGDCLEPVIPDRATVMIKKSETFDVGDVVVIWFRPELIAPGKPQSSLKRITMNAPPWVKFPYKDHPESDVQALIMVEQLNPPTGYRLRCADIIAIHKAIGYSPAGGTIGGTVSTGDMLPIGGKSRSGKRKSRAGKAVQE
jgi:hypothetical protein